MTHKLSDLTNPGIDLASIAVLDAYDDKFWERISTTAKTECARLELLEQRLISKSSDLAKQFTI